MRKWCLVLIASALLLAGCDAAKDGSSAQINAQINSESTHNPTAQEVLQQNPDADFFQLNDVIYTNAATIDWVQSESLTAQEKIGSIAKTYTEGAVFENGMATKLPAGAEIYAPDTHGSLIVTVKWDGHEVRYLALLEG